MTSDHTAPPEQDVPRTPAQRFRGWMVAGLTALSVRNTAFGVFLVLLVVSLPFGGMKASSAPKVTVLTKDEAITAAPFTITYKGAWQTDDLGGDLFAAPKLDDGSHYLIVAALVRTSADSSVPYQTLSEAIRLVGVPGLTRGGLDSRPVKDSRRAAPDTILVDADYHAMGDLPPNLTYGLYWLWVQRPGEPVPSTLDVMVQSTTYRKSSIDQTFGYFDPVEEARGTVPVARWKSLVPTSADEGAG